MSHKIQISDHTFQRLQAHATPLVDTTESVINKALDALEFGGGAVPKPSSLDPQIFDPLNPPNLTFTTIRTIELNEERFQPNQWNALLLAVAREAMLRLKDREKVHNLISVKCVAGKKTDTGYKYVENADLSIQGQDANNAWKGIARLALGAGISVGVVFAWSDNPKAANPGMLGRLLISGN